MILQTMQSSLSSGYNLRNFSASSEETLIFRILLPRKMSRSESNFIKIRSMQKPTQPERVKLKYSKSILAVLICLLIFTLISFKPVLAYSEDFQIVSSLFPITRNIELSKGDQVYGELKLSNLPTEFSLSVWIEDSDGNRIMDILMAVPHTEEGQPITGERIGKFNFTASYSGIYRLKILYFSSMPAIVVNAKLTYNIKSPNPFTINLPPEIIYFIIGFIAIPIISYIIYKAIKR